jgi:tetratricopeptide (TPR) repeat protein
MTRYQVARVEDIEEMDDGRCPYRPVRHHFGITTFGATTWTAKNAGDRLINEHDEQDEFDELYLVLSGAARFEIAGDTVDAQAGTFVRVPPGVMRTAFAQDAGTTILAVGGGREGEPYRPGGWEVWSPLRPLMAAGRHEELVSRAKPLLEDEPPYPELLYNVACSESLLGRTDDALRHLRRAVELMPELARFARDDEDLAPLRHEAAFRELTRG